MKSTLITLLWIDSPTP